MMAGTGATPRRVTSADGTGIAVHPLGGQGPDLVLAHATGLHGMVMAPLGAALAEHFTCWALDFRGHGDSDPLGKEPMDWFRLAEDVVAVVEELDISPAVGFGHSLGGGALLLAELASPGTFTHLMAYEPAMVARGSLHGPDSRRAEIFADMARRRRAEFPSRAEALEHFARRRPLNECSAEVLLAYVDHGMRDQEDGQVHLKCEPATEAEMFDSCDGHDGYDRLGEIGCPVVMAWGQYEDDLNRRARHRLAQVAPAWTAVEAPGLAHMGPLQNPVQVADLVVEHLHPGGNEEEET